MKLSQFIGGHKVASALTITSLLLSACSTNPTYQETINSQYKQHQITLDKPLSTDDKADLVEAVVSADMAFQQQDYVSATSYYLFAAQLTRSPELIQQAVQSARLAGDDLGLQQASELWVEQQPENNEARISLIIAELKSQDLESALLQTEQLLKRKKNEQEAYEWLSRIVLASQGRISLAWLSQLKQHYPDSAAVTLTQAKLLSEWAAQTQNPEQTLAQALGNASKALKQAPHMDSAVELKTQLLFRLRRDEEAEAFLRAQFTQRPDSAKTAELLGHLLYDLKKFQLAVSHYKPWLETHPDDLDARYYLAASYYALRDYKNSLSAFRRLLDKDFEANTVAYYCGDSAKRLQQLAQAKACFGLVGDGRFFTSAQIEIARILGREQKLQQALQRLRTAEAKLTEQSAADFSAEELEKQQTQLLLAEIDLLETCRGQQAALTRLEQALQQLPNNLALLFRQISLQDLETDATALTARLQHIRQTIQSEQLSQRFERAAAALLFNNGHHRAAVNWVKQALKQNPDDQELLYSKAIYLEPLGEFEEMIKTFKHLLELSPGNINVMNALGYTLVDLNQDLDYAATLINKAYQAAPNNPAIIDSKGWLAYRRGDLEKAVKYLRASFKLNPSAEVGTHLGEVLWQAKKPQQAMAVWQQASRLDRQNYLLKKTLKRLGVELADKNKDNENTNNSTRQTQQP